jgi:hypothetical protein
MSCGDSRRHGITFRRRALPSFRGFAAIAGGDRAGREEIVNLRAGTLDDTRWLVPVAHMFMTSAQPWVLPAADAECHEIGPDDFRPLSLKWRAMWPEFFP